MVWVLQACCQDQLNPSPSLQPSCREPSRGCGTLHDQVCEARQAVWGVRWMPTRQSWVRRQRYVDETSQDLSEIYWWDVPRCLPLAQMLAKVVRALPYLDAVYTSPGLFFFFFLMHFGMTLNWANLRSSIWRQVSVEVSKEWTLYTSPSLNPRGVWEMKAEMQRQDRELSTKVTKFIAQERDPGMSGQCIFKLCGGYSLNSVFSTCSNQNSKVFFGNFPTSQGLLGCWLSLTGLYQIPNC